MTKQDDDLTQSINKQENAAKERTFSCDVAPETLVRRGIWLMEKNEDLVNATTVRDSAAVKALENAVEMFEQAALAGDSDGQYWLGYCYRYGKGVTRNYEKAVKWFTKAVYQNNAEAQYELSACFKDGCGVRQDDIVALALIKLAANQEYVSAIYSLADYYYYGRVVKQDIEAGIDLYFKVYENNYFYKDVFHWKLDAIMRNLILKREPFCECENDVMEKYISRYLHGIRRDDSLEKFLDILPTNQEMASLLVRMILIHSVGILELYETVLGRFKAFLREEEVLAITEKAKEEFTDDFLEEDLKHLLELAAVLSDCKD